jgi:hypothetical protein
LGGPSAQLAGYLAVPHARQRKSRRHYDDRPAAVVSKTKSGCSAQKSSNC